MRYIKGNRKPNAQIKADKTQGGTPLVVNFDASESEDPDYDDLKFSWNFGDGNQDSGEKVSYTFDEAGVYDVKLTIVDSQGEVSENMVKIYAGNEPPIVAWDLSGGNERFFFPGQSLDYKVFVSDDEDGSLGSGITDSDVTVTIDFLENGFDMVESAMGHQALSEMGSSNAGFALISGSDCLSCHKTSEKSIGPAYVDIAQKYKDDPDAISYLSEKIISGGGGIWGETAMAAHPDLTTSDARKMAQYIMNLGKEAETVKKLPVSGSFTFDKDPMQFPSGSYILTASYKDKGAKGVEGIQARDIKVLRSPMLLCFNADEIENANPFTVTKEMVPTLEKEMDIVFTNDDATIAFNDLDLSGVENATFLYTASPGFMGGGTVTFHIDDENSDPIHEAELNFTEGFNPGMVQFALGDVKGKHKLIMKFKAKDPEKAVASAISLLFST